MCNLKQNTVNSWAIGRKTCKSGTTNFSSDESSLAEKNEDLHRRRTAYFLTLEADLDHMTIISVRGGLHSSTLVVA